MTKPENYYTVEGSGRLAEMIEEYWRQAGYAGIVAKRFRITDAPHKTIGDELWGVRSNIGPTGFPPRKAAQSAA